ncbi:MAG: Peptidyl-tRNA hydrolase [Candidatus Woesebacteria bacterium GW2011_GWA1_37_8]|uniref:Peptidyl-tRNA hydrolase n=2 Tax=Candidatus Woeseibacteriota TaxID=1752722 RepID=A0A0G0LFS2_9BACT|nr:MAG: Peptidyl-tRNA hydrolase [Candidatus Woesebacteria bacterium GW2011_GWA1_37_8]KKQ86785.1 MAG: Peptidyl-tRNA hydrolase [Candidatus Woesebacteria bacterium GW2011_GWB1_38_8b]
MKLIVGLGNVGENYINTRHNVGFLVVEKLAEKLGSEWLIDKKFKSFTAKQGSLVIFSKPTNMMNNSGIAVQKLISFYHVQISDLWIIHDDLDIKLGQYKIQLGVGPKVHNGLNSVYEKLGNDKFWHVRIGVDNRDGENRTPGETYVLQNFSEEEAQVLNDVIDKLVKELLNITL